MKYHSNNINQHVNMEKKFKPLWFLLSANIFYRLDNLLYLNIYIYET